ncbi:MAG: 5,10-methylenetetrahydrofolate reductase, partial [Actinobacteria bacterium]|nr:5,10-methylenetetrahydrofolate reductase [Actinomycetota bacterium]
MKPKLKEALAAGDFALTCEIGPVKGTDTAEIYEIGEMLKGLVNGINVTDLQSSVMRLGSLTTCHLLTDMGHDPVFQMTCRDRNRLALQSDALSAYVLGIRNVLSLTGDHVTVGDHPQAKPVYDLDSVSLLYTLSRLEEGYDLAGNELKGKPAFFKGAVVNPGADSDASLDLQLIKMQKKIDAGAEFFQTQAVFDEEVVEKFMEKIDKLNIKTPVMAGVILLKSEKMANYMNKNVPGILVPKRIIDKMANTTDKVSMCLEILTDLIIKIRPICAGVHIQALGWEKHVPAL